MTYKEYGKQNDDVIILLHGGGLSWWNYRETAERLQSDFRVILPVLDGHADSDKGFTTIENNAADLIAFIDENFGGKVLLIGGLSLGGQVLLEMLDQRENICRYAIVESALVVPSKGIHSLIEPALSISYGLIRHKWFSRLQFKYLRINPDLFDDYYRDTCGITRENTIAFLQANALYQLKPTIVNCSAIVSIYVGSKEGRAMQISAKKIHEKLRGSSLTVLPGLHHGAFSINNAGTYAEAICAMVWR